MYLHRPGPPNSQDQPWQLLQQQQQQLQQQQQQQQQQLQQQQQQQQLQQQQEQQQQQQQQHQSLASHFHLLQLAESLAEGIESGTRDQHLDALVGELTSQFDKCQQLLNSISASLNVKAVTVEGQKQKLEETEQLLNHRRELFTNYRSSIQKLLNTDSAI